MIIQAILDLIKGLLTTLFGMFPSIPSFDGATESIKGFFELIFSNASIIGVFVNVETIKLCVPIAIGIWQFENIYKITMWIYKKIPIVGSD